MSDPDRRALELRWLQNERDLCRLYDMKDPARKSFVTCVERLEAEQERIEADLAKYCADPVSEVLRGWPDNDDLLCVSRVRGSVHVHSADGLVYPQLRRIRGQRP
jgi:hypothetical protein